MRAAQAAGSRQLVRGLSPCVDTRARNKEQGGRQLVRGFEALWVGAPLRGYWVSQQDRDGQHASVIAMALHHHTAAYSVCGTRGAHTRTAWNARRRVSGDTKVVEMSQILSWMPRMLTGMELHAANGQVCARRESAAMGLHPARELGAEQRPSSRKEAVAVQVERYVSVAVGGVVVARGAKLT